VPGTGECDSAGALARLAQTPARVQRIIDAHDGAVLSRRPGPDSWSATEIVCHLRDVEELFQTRFHTILALDEPTIFVLGADPEKLIAWGIGGAVTHPLDPDRWAIDRQYARNDPREAAAAFVRRRREVLALLSGLTPAQWVRGGIHLKRGRQALSVWAASLAAHDDNHLAQLERAVEGKP
jgi:hypothetical protein